LNVARAAFPREGSGRQNNERWLGVAEPRTQRTKVLAACGAVMDRMSPDPDARPHIGVQCHSHGSGELQKSSRRQTKLPPCPRIMAAELRNYTEMLRKKVRPIFL
jgi:hypothetical protein